MTRMTIRVQKPKQPPQRIRYNLIRKMHGNHLHPRQPLRFDLHRAILVRQHARDIRVVGRVQRHIAKKSELIVDVFPGLGHRRAYQVFVDGEAGAVEDFEDGRRTRDGEPVHFDVVGAPLGADAAGKSRVVGMCVRVPFLAIQLPQEESLRTLKWCLGSLQSGC